MRRDSWLQVASYASVAIIAVALAFLVALRVLPKSYSQAQKPPAANAKPGAPGVTPTQAADTAKAVLEEVTGFLEPFIYDARNRRDPFQPYVDVRPSTGPDQQPVYLTPLQKFELSEFHLVGIMWDIHDPKAMFVDPEHQVHVVGRDESIGKKNGYIAVIREGEVVVVESNRGKDGNMAFKPTVLRIER